MKQQYSGSGYGNVFYVFFYQLSKLSVQSLPHDYHVDAFWAMLDPDRTRFDDDYLLVLNRRTRSPYAKSYNKLKMICLLLSKNNVLPKAKFQNLVHEEYLRTPHKKLGSGEKPIEYRDILNGHWKWMEIATYKGMGIGVHVDVMWALVAPYVTQEDADSWNGIMKNLRKFGEAQYGYEAIMKKIELCSRVADRAGLQLQRGTVDDGTLNPDGWEVEDG